MLSKAGTKHILLLTLAIITVVVTFSLAGCVTVTPTSTPYNIGGKATSPALSQGAKIAPISGVKLGDDTGIFSKVAVNTTLDDQSSLVSYSGGGNGVKGMSDTWNGVLGMASTSGTGVAGGSDSGMGVYGTSKSGNGVKGESNSGSGVVGTSNSGEKGVGVLGRSVSGYGVGVKGESDTTFGTGVLGSSVSGFGVYGTSDSGYGVRGLSKGGGTGGYFTSSNGISLVAAGAKAAVFSGKVEISGTLTKSSGTFKIDHPQDPANKYLSHSFVESPDMKNVYDSTILLDDNGEAVVELPSYFEALNRDFRYQLTCIGGYAPIYVAEKVKDNSFKIAGGKAGMEISWQVTGIRKDPFANAHPVIVEEEKPANEKGFYLNPVEWGQPQEKGIYQLAKP